MEEKKKNTILIVDDTPDNITLLCALLGDEYRNRVSTNGQKALQIAATDPQPDLILLDIMMPEMDGYEVCAQLKASPKTRDIPVIFLTAKTQEGDETKGFELGAVDYITKPIVPAILLARVHTQLSLEDARHSLALQNEHLEHEVEKRTRQLVNLQEAVITAMAAMAESRDTDTGDHILRTQYYIKALAQHLQKKEKYAKQIDDKFVELLYKSAPLHDIGKVGVPDNILLKPGKLTSEEFEIMKMHTIYGRDAIIAAEKKLDVEETFLTFARDIAHYHHERWDGSGYPRGLKGEETPLCARLMAVGDVYDALTTKRVYKDAIPHEESVKIIAEGSGSHFDPEIIDCFLEINELFREISEQYRL